MSSPEGSAEVQQSSESSTDYDALLNEAKADVRPGEEGYVPDPDKARFMAETQDRYEERAQSKERIAGAFNELADQRAEAGRRAASEDAKDTADQYARGARKQRKKMVGAVDDAGEFYDEIHEDKAA